MSQNTPAMNTQKFNEVEERIFALLDNAEQTQQQSTDLLTKLSSILERLEKSETECNQQVEVLKQQAITAEKKRQDEWDAWKKQQAQLWQTEQKSQFENWQQAQSSQWQTWQDKQQQKLTNSIATFNQSADNLINKLGWCLNSKFSIFISLLNIILVDKNMNSRNVHCLLLRETQALTNKPTHSSPNSRITTLYMACFTPILATFMQTWIKGFIIGFPHIAFGDEVLITWRNVCAKLLTGFNASITNIITDYLFCSTT